MWILVVLVFGQVYAHSDNTFPTQAACEVMLKQEQRMIGELFTQGVLTHGPHGEQIKPSDVSIECHPDD